MCRNKWLCTCMNTPNSTNVFDLIYPVGSIYLSVSDVSPATLFGGSWERITDRFLLGAGGSYAGGVTGGESSHTLTVSEIPSHSHTSYGVAFANPKNDDSYYVAMRSVNRSNQWTADSTKEQVASTGGSAAHNNMPPYLAVHMWKRVS